MKTRIAVYLTLLILISLVLSFKFYPPFRNSELIAKLMGKEVMSITSGEGAPILAMVLDLNGDGIGINPITSPPVLFDHIGNGIKIGTSWISPSDGFLVIDLNKNGIVDNGTEILGNHLKAGAENAVNSFKVLSTADDNGDGEIDNKDAIFSRLMIWQDINGDAICQPTELLPLDKFGISAIHTSQVTQQSIGVKTLGVGNFELKRYDSSAVTTREFMDISFDVNTFVRSFSTTVAITNEAELLPDMKGSGLVRDMREAASLSSGFAQILSEYSNAVTREGQLKLLDELIAAWGKTTGFADMQTRAKENGYSLTSNLDAKNLLILTVMEQFNGRGFLAMPWEEHIGTSAQQGFVTTWYGDPKQLKVRLAPNQIQFLLDGYKKLKDSVYRALLTQTRLKPYYDAVDTVPFNGSYVYDFSLVEETFVKNFNLDPEKAIIDLVEFNQINRNEWKKESWTDLGDHLLERMLTKVTPSPILQKTLSNFSISIPLINKQSEKQEALVRLK